jgi:hypothetical protein
MTSAPVLQLPNQSLKWVLYTDASGYAVGGVLCQPHGDTIKPVIFLSHKLSGTELNWPVYEKEFFAIIYCLKQCQWYLQGNDVIIYTDHKSLQYFISQKSLSPKQSRWIEFLSSFYCKIEYKEGRYNVVADALSRRPDHQSSDNDTIINYVSDSAEVIRRAIRVNSIAETSSALQHTMMMKHANPSYNQMAQQCTQYKMVLYTKVIVCTFHHTIASNNQYFMNTMIQRHLRTVV